MAKGTGSGSSAASAASTIWSALADPSRRAFYVHGPEEGLYRLFIDEVARRARDQGADGRTVLEGEQAWQEASSLALTPTLWPGARLLVALPEGRPDPASAEQLARALEQPVADTFLVVRDPGGDLGPGGRALRRHSKAVAVAAVRGRELPAIVRKAGQLIGLPITDAVANRVATRTGHDLLRILPELVKLRDGLDEGEAITVQTVDRLVPIWPEGRSFAVGDAYFRADLAGAFTALRAALAAGESPFALFGLLARDVRLMSLAEEQAQLKGHALTAEELAAPLGLGQAYQASGVARAVAAGRPKARGAYVALLEADGELKSETPPEIALGRLLVKLIGTVNS